MRTTKTTITSKPKQMKIITRENLNGEFYAEITTKKNAVFKTMSFKKLENAKKYGIEFLNTFSERVQEPKKWTQKEVREAFSKLGFEFPENEEQLKAFNEKFKNYPYKLNASIDPIKIIEKGCSFDRREIKKL